jgi:predicted nucleotidyltransferase
MFTRKTARIEAGNFLRDLKNFGFSPTRAILFGSMVNGRHHAWSDIDLAVWDENFTGPLAMDYEKILPVLRPYTNLELHTFHPGETAETNPFAAEIIRTGIELEV